MDTNIIRERIDDLAGDIGRLRKRLPEDDELGGWILDRIAGHVETLQLMHTPSAAELAAGAYPGDAQAIEAAIATVDSWSRRLRQRMGVT